MAKGSSLRDRIDDDLKAAMKSGDKLRLGVLRMIKARMTEAEVALRSSRGRDYRLEDAESNGVLASCAKQRRDSIESYRQGGREDLATAEEQELAVLQEYLPRQMSPEEIRKIASEAIASTGAISAKDIGAVMKIVMPKVKGAADGKLVSRIVGELLG